MDPVALSTKHLQSHENLSPRCLCSINKTDTFLDYHSCITRAEAGLHAGEYIFRCSTNQCGYVGESLLFVLKNYTYLVISQSLWIASIEMGALLVRLYQGVVSYFKSPMSTLTLFNSTVKITLTP